MTITSSDGEESPLFAVMGATGTQGGSVIKAIQESTQSYRVRAITRDSSKAGKLEELGCEVVVVDPFTEKGATRSLSGCDIAFLMTLSEYWAEDPIASETAHGTMLMDVARDCKVETVIWAGLTNISKASGGAWPVPLFDVKSEVTEHGRALKAFKLIDVQPGAYFQNYFGFYAPIRAEDGTFIITRPQKPSTVMPLIDMEEDYGKYVVAGLEHGQLETVYAASEYISNERQAEEFTKGIGKAVIFKEVSVEEMEQVLVQKVGPVNGVLVNKMLVGTGEQGYFGGVDLSNSNAILSKPARTVAEMVGAYSDRLAEVFA